MKIKASGLIGAALDWAVAKCEDRNVTGWRNGFIFLDGQPGSPILGLEYAPSTDWAQGGPIIERERITNGPYHDADGNVTGEFQGYIGWDPDELEPRFQADGPTPLIAAMRCYVASRLGDDVEIPKELS